MKKDFELNYKSKAALNSPPHITLHMPFKLKPTKELELINLLSEMSASNESFELALNGFGHFNEKVIYVSVSRPKELQTLYEELAKKMRVAFQIFNSDYKNRGYHPHMTIAFRSLNKENFKKAWPVYEVKKYERVFFANYLTLLKHDGKVWKPFNQFPLSITTL